MRSSASSSDDSPETRTPALQMRTKFEAAVRGPSQVHRGLVESHSSVPSDSGLSLGIVRANASMRSTAVPLLMLTRSTARQELVTGRRPQRFTSAAARGDWHTAPAASG
jgi:hypothetical protein